MLAQTQPLERRGRRRRDRGKKATGSLAFPRRGPQSAPAAQEPRGERLGRFRGPQAGAARAGPDGTGLGAGLPPPGKGWAHCCSLACRWPPPRAGDGGGRVTAPVGPEGWMWNQRELFWTLTI